MMKRALKISLALVGALGLLRCGDLNKTGNQLASRTAFVGTLLATPAIELKASAVAVDLDAGLVMDSGVTFDAGLLGDAGYTVPPQTAVTLFVGTLQGTGLVLQPVGISGATASLVQVGGATTALVDKGGGAYGFVADGGGLYVSNATYEFRATTGTNTYVGEIQNVPALERCDGLHPSAGYLELEALQPFTFTRPAPASGTERPLAFVSVYTVSPAGMGPPTYTNMPTTPLDFLKLIVAPGDWKSASVTIPGSAFPLKNTNYVITLQAAKTGGAKSDNLFTGSALLASTADLGVVKTKP